MKTNSVDIFNNVRRIYQEYQEANEDISILTKYKNQFMNIANGFFILNREGYSKKIPTDCLRMFIIMCLDYYNFSENGDILIDDSVYDDTMQIYISQGNKAITCSNRNVSTWDLIKHSAPFMVGSVKKVYDYDALSSYVKSIKEKYGPDVTLLITPKWDGVSSAIEHNSKQLITGVTRKDGVYGQNITQVIENAWNLKSVLKSVEFDGYIKTELCVSTEDFNAIKEETGYKNRRSATTGIVNTPKNLQYANRITIIPLFAVSKNKDKIQFMHPICHLVKDVKVKNVFKHVEEILDDVRKPEYQFRIDGVVIYPFVPSKWDNMINTNDLLEDAVAYKINTAYGTTEVIDAYPSVGRTGEMTPMLKVKPVEVNETTVEDVSLSNMNKFDTYALHKGETITIYSAGDVIPMVEFPKERKYPKDAELLTIQSTCPHCGKEFVKNGKKTFCANQECERIITGRIINFLDKLKVNNISDRTIEILYENKLLLSIYSLFNLVPPNDSYQGLINKIEGFNTVSTQNLCNEIGRLVEREITHSQLYGALGIPKISDKKCRKLFMTISHEEINAVNNNNKWDDLYKKINNIKGFKDKTTTTFIEFVKKELPLINFLYSWLNIVDEKPYKGNFVFTGFRDKDLSERFEELNYYESNNINEDTKFLIAAEMSGKKYKRCIEEGIRIIPLQDVEEFILELGDLQ